MARKQQIQIIRGLKANLISLGALNLGELAFCTDTKEVYIGNGTSNYFVGRVLSGDFESRPNAGDSGRFYYVASGKTNVGYLYLDAGNEWVKANALTLSDLAGSLDNISDGANYVRIKATEASNGVINRLNDGTNIVTAAEARAHMNDVLKHRTINDGGSSNTDLWSAQKIKNEIELAKHNIEPQASVKDKDLLIPPTSTTLGDRYIVSLGAATGLWTGKNNQIVEWNGASWEFYMPQVGWTCYVDDEQKLYSWNGTAWVRTGGALQSITAGVGLTGGGQADTIILNIGQGPGIAVGADSISVTGYKGITVDSNGVSANIDGVSIMYDAANSNKLTIGTIDGGTF